MRHHSADEAMNMNAGGSHPAFGPTTTPPPPYPTMPPAYAGNDATATLQIPSNNLARSVRCERKIPRELILTFAMMIITETDKIPA